MRELKLTEQKTPIRLDAIAAEFDTQKEAADPFTLMRNVFGNYKNGPLIVALGAVGGNGAGSKAAGILEQLQQDGIPFRVAMMKKYGEANPLISTYLAENKVDVMMIDDNCTPEMMYKNCDEAIQSIVATQSISGILSLGPRTYYPEAARRSSIPAMIIDGAVPDKWEATTGQTGYPTTAYFEQAYQYATYATTCGFTGWQPPKNTYPNGMNLRVIQQPFSNDKIVRMKQIRSLSPQEARAIILAKNTITGFDDTSLIIVPTMDQVYVNPQALASNGGFMTDEQFGQAYAFMTETIVSATKLAIERGEKVSLYIRPGIIEEMLKPVLQQYKNEVNIIQPENGIVENDDWLLLRKAGVVIGRAPLCVSTAEALAIDDYQITAAVPGDTSDGLSYMTEPKGLVALNRKGVSRTLFPGDSLLTAIKDVIEVKRL